MKSFLHKFPRVQCYWYLITTRTNQVRDYNTVRVSLGFIVSVTALQVGWFSDLSTTRYCTINLYTEHIFLSQVTSLGGVQANHARLDEFGKGE